MKHPMRQNRQLSGIPLHVSVCTTALAALLVTLAAASPMSAAEPVRAKNVLFLMGDDHAAYVMSVYGNELVRTPNLDRLATQGARFDRAYVNAPVCSPSRQSIITGKLPHASGVTILSTPLAEEQVTIADHLKQFGYATGAIGKMHFNSNLTHGFDYRIDRPDYRRHLQENPPRPPAEGVRVRPQWRPFRDPARIWLNADALPSQYYDEDSESTWFVEKAVEFLEENQENPFCLWLSFYEPHSPFNFPIEFAGRYDPQEMPLPPVGVEDGQWIPAEYRDMSDEDRRGIVSAYYSSVEYLDKNVGLTLDALDRLGLADDTLVVYVGDHGYLLAHHGRFEKHMMWEPAVHAPLLMRAPGLEPKVTDAMVEFIDLVPTILDVLEVKPMDGLQGRSLLPLLEGTTDTHRSYVFSEFLPDNKAMVRTERWKYIFSTGEHDLSMGYQTGNGPPGITHRLYDTVLDPNEHQNLAGRPEFSGVLKTLQFRMLQRFQETDPRAARLPPQFTLEESLVFFCQPPETPSF